LRDDGSLRLVRGDVEDTRLEPGRVELLLYDVLLCATTVPGSAGLTFVLVRAIRPPKPELG
jgi:hypothetical protein